MKSLALLLLVIGSCYAEFGIQDVQHLLDDTGMGQKIAKVIVATMFAKVSGKGNEHLPSTRVDGAYPIPVVDEDFPDDSPYAQYIFGYLSLSGEDAQVEFTSFEPDIIEGENTLTFTAPVGSLTAHGEHAVDLTFFETLRLISTGNYSGTLVNGLAQIDLVFANSDVIDTTDVTLTLEFDSVEIFTDSTSFAFGDEDPTDIDWEVVNPLIKTVFDSVINLIKPTLEETLKTSLNQILAECTWDEVEAGDYSCLDDTDDNTGGTTPPTSSSTASTPSSPTSTPSSPTSTPSSPTSTLPTTTDSAGHNVSLNIFLLVSAFALCVSHYYK